MSLFSALNAYLNQRGLYIDLARGHLEDAKSCRRYGDVLGSRCHLAHAQRNRRRAAAMNEQIATLITIIED